MKLGEKYWWKNWKKKKNKVKTNRGNGVRKFQKHCSFSNTYTWM
jgi:hypothetical protein